VIGADGALYVKESGRMNNQRPIVKRIDQAGNVTVREGINYGQETYGIPACLTAANEIALTQAGESGASENRFPSRISVSQAEQWAESAELVFQLRRETEFSDGDFNSSHVWLQMAWVWCQRVREVISRGKLMPGTAKTITADHRCQ